MRRLVHRTTGAANLNAGTMSPTPLPVLAEVTRLRRLQAAGPSDFLWRQSPPLLEHSRGRLAEYINCRGDQLLLLSNVTWGLNVVSSSLDLPAGSEILTTDHEYGAMDLMWRRLSERRGWRIRRVVLPYRSERPDDIVRAFESAFTRRTRLLFFSHVTSTTGLVLPAGRLCRLARRRGAMSVIDGAHAPGMVPVDLRAIGADYYAANCHKWMMAPATVGFLHVRRPLRETLQPPITSWGWGYEPRLAHKPSPWGGTRWQQCHEFHGCEDRTPQMVLGETLDFRKRLGGDEAVGERCRELAAHGRRRLAELGLTPATPENPELSGALVAGEFASPEQAPPDHWLWNNYRIECPVTRPPGRAFLRISAAWFVTTGEIDRLARAMGDWMKQKKEA